MMRRLLAFGLPVVALAGCTTLSRVPLPPLPGIAANTPAAERVSGSVGAPPAAPPPTIAYGNNPQVRPHPNVRETAAGDISLDFADTDLREVVSQILGAILHENYAIDPAVKGSATFHTASPLPRSRLIPTLQVLLAQNGATMIQVGGVYRVVTIADAGNGGVVGSDADAGSVVLPLRYASADALAKILTPFATNGAKIGADPGRNALAISGDPASRNALISLAQSFDVDLLAGQSYALLPVPAGDPKDFASAMQDAFRGQNGGALAGLVRVVPLQRLASVLVIASNTRYVEEARRMFAVVEKARQFSERIWHVNYLQNSHADDVAYMLQLAFTPNHVTAQPTSQTRQARGTSSLTGGGFGGAGGAFGSSGGTGALGGGGGGGLGGGLGGGIGGGTGSLGSNGGLGAGSSEGGGTRSGSLATGTTTTAANPLLGGLDSGSGQGNEADLNSMRIIPNPQNNAVLIYATPQEQATVEAMLRKIDILPLQVRIDAVIAEVTLNDQLQYGTQFLFKGSSLGTALSGAASGGITATLFRDKGIGETLAALQSITNVQVLSSPQLLVLDNETAQLQVGALVPYLSQTSQSTLTSGAPVVNSVQYQQTGVIMDVTPRVNSGGLVTLDIAQEVSDVSSVVTTSGLNSPTFNERRVTSRVVVQDGQTIGLAGLIQDSRSRANEGVPWLKDLPVLGFFLGQQNNTRDRTELLVLITPHVLHDQRDARALTEDLREQLPNAAALPPVLQNLPLTGSPDPNAVVRQKLRLGP